MSFNNTDFLTDVFTYKEAENKFKSVDVVCKSNEDCPEGTVCNDLHNCAFHYNCLKNDTSLCYYSIKNIPNDDINKVGIIECITSKDNSECGLGNGEECSSDDQYKCLYGDCVKGHCGLTQFKLSTKETTIGISILVLIILSINYGDIFRNLISKELLQLRKEYVNSLYNNNEVIPEEYHSMKIKIKKAIEEEENTNIFKENDEDSKCFNFINDKMPLALSKYYVEKKFSENIKSETINMIENIRNAMIYRIKELEWLDESTREYAIKKVLNIKYLIGHSDYIMNIENLYDIYKFFEQIQYDDPMSLLIGSLNVYYHDFFVRIYNENRKIEEEAEDIIENIMPAYEVNAVYSPLDNLMSFPAGVLQSPNFDINQPDYINYGNTGSTIGHELTHAFDNNGKNYDAEGKQSNWWTDNDNEDSMNFLNVSLTKGEKYNVDGERTLGENLADNGGLDRAYEAWKLSIENNPEKAKERNKLLPGLSNYTMDQLFYISFAHSNCEVGVSEYANEDEHSPGKSRVNGSVSNNKRFAKIFNCPTKSPMNPDMKCVLW
ncbi:zincin [Anaeromyces robustus]|uniref:Zincin n=1 Tax=Anaeromyces robustus TaxID=1754192 RepID=A0A1Y1X1Z9_9FUNG|nr:zincin [Anaeromyces robustus]|eukprot:ORX79354.1 zincin [Anaeromyces robustus]